MNMLKKGPEIKLPDLKNVKAPDFLQDLYYDLKDRHLLPLVVLLIVAMFAVPIALGQSGPQEPEAEAPAIATPSAVASGSGELVAKSTPGLRDYRKRLNHMQAENPFKQQYASEETQEASGASGSGETTEGETGGISESSPEPPVEVPTTPGTNGDGETDPNRLTYYSYAIDVRVATGGAKQSDDNDSQVRRNLPELTMLPSRETPALVYMGSTKDGKKAVMMVSSNVEAIFGDAKCVLGSDSCQLLIMEPGVPETLVYGGEGRTYKVELLKVRLVETDKLNRAPLGKPKKNKGKGKSQKPDG